MTTPYPAAPGPYPGAPAPYPTAILPPSPLQLGQAIGASFEILKRRFGMFVALAVVPGALVALLAVLAIGGIAAAAFAVTAGGTATPATGQIGGFIGASAVAMLLIGLLAGVIQIKANGMAILLAHDTVEGRRPALGDLLAATQGLVRRSIPVILAAIGAVVVLYALMGGIMFGAVFAAINAGNSRSGGMAAANSLMSAMALVVLLWFALGITWLYVGTRWLYYQQALTLERTPGLASLGRSWALTRGNFWRTLGWYLLGTLLIGLVSMLVNALTSALTLPLQTAASSSLQDANSGGAAFVAMLPLLIVSSLIAVVVEALTLPALLVYITVMYLDQVRRSQLAAAGVLTPAGQYLVQPGFAGYGAPGYPAQTAPGYPTQQAQPPYGYPGPQPGYPAQPGYPPGAGYPTQQGEPPYGYGPQPGYGQSWTPPVASEPASGDAVTPNVDDTRIVPPPTNAP